jgi:hypothetical protein
MADKREKTAEEQEQIGRTTDEDITDAADDDFEDTEDDLDQDEGDGEREAIE